MGYGRVNAFYAVSAPSQPTNFSGTTQNNHPELSWNANSEPDIDNYEIWKKENTGSYSLYATTTDTYYVDTSEDVISQPEANDKDVYYKVRASDVSSKKSAFTSAIHYLVKGDPAWSKNAKSDGQNMTISRFRLAANHPNPFNPTTHISYALPEASIVTLEVFDVSGRKVSVLVKKSQEQGWHYATFDGGTLPSGIYVYRISATGMESGKGFTQAKRMLLVK